MAAIKSNTHHGVMRSWLASHGWTIHPRRLDLNLEETYQLGAYATDDMESAVDHQKHLDDMERERIKMARPRFHWGLDIAFDLGAAP